MEGSKIDGPISERFISGQEEVATKLNWIESQKFEVRVNALHTASPTFS